MPPFHSVKFEASIRTIPVHLKLIELGLLECHSFGNDEKWFFPKKTIGGVNALKACCQRLLVPLLRKLDRDSG